MNISHATLFAYWLSMQPEAGIIPSQADATINVMDRLPNGDLVAILYHGGNVASLKAIKLLRERFVDEMDALNNELMMQAEADHAGSWN